MAFKIAELYAEIRARDSKFRMQMAKVHAITKRVEVQMQAVSRAARRMLLVGTAALGVMVRTSASFEQAMARTKALTGATEKEFQKLRQTALDLGKTTQFSARQAAEAMGYFALAGFKTNEIIAAMPDTLNLAAAGQLDMGTAADITAKIMAGMGLTSKELGHAVDVLAKAFTTANTDLIQLGEAMKYVGPIGKGAGKSLEELAAAIQIMSNAGIQGSQAGAALRNILVRLQAQPTEVKKSLDALGVSIADTTGRMRPLADIIDDLNSSMAGLTEIQKQAYIAQIAGMRSIAAMSELLIRGGDELRKYERALSDSGGTAERIAKIQMETLQGQLIRLKSSAEGAAIALGTAFHETVETLALTIKGFTDKINALTDAEKAVIVTTVKWSALALGLVSIIPKLAMVVGALSLAGGPLLLFAAALVPITMLLGAHTAAILKSAAAYGKLGQAVDYSSIAAVKSALVETEKELRKQQDAVKKYSSFWGKMLNKEAAARKEHAELMVRQLKLRRAKTSQLLQQMLQDEKRHADKTKEIHKEQEDKPGTIENLVKQITGAAMPEIKLNIKPMFVGAEDMWRRISSAGKGENKTVAKLTEIADAEKRVAKLTEQTNQYLQTIARNTGQPVPAVAGP